MVRVKITIRFKAKAIDKVKACKAWARAKAKLKVNSTVRLMLLLNKVSVT